ncbi:MAG: hypothetical protein IJV27_08350 [Prevotella sp.]|nr:hypothetical protein [Prevotella sp.]
MAKLISKYAGIGVSILFGVGVFLFWGLAYPQALSYQEQYQLFLFTGDYLAERLTIAGGLADYLGEFLVQFYYVEWLGAVILALLFVVLQRLIYRLTSSVWNGLTTKHHHFFLSFIPPFMFLWYMGDESVLLSYFVAMLISLGVAYLMKKNQWFDLVVIPLLYWAVGPMAWLYVSIRIVRYGWRRLWMVIYLLALQIGAYVLLLSQWPLQSVLLGLNYYRVPLQVPTMQWLIPVAIVLLVALAPFCRKKITAYLQMICLAVVAFLSVYLGYDSDKYELLRQDYHVRNEQWNEVIRRAEKYQVRTTFSSNCVNLALAKKRQLADRMFDFYQSGEDALLMPMVRDLTSNLPTAEVFWHLGMVNSAERYMFDIQESILNARKSGRCTKRLAECFLVNGKYSVARKHLNLLKKSLFYRNWAKEAETYLYQDAKIDAHPIWGKLRQLRYKSNFLYNYGEIDKMLGLLFINNPENKMALDYFMGEMLLKGNVQGFQQYMSWVQQYGGYQFMPMGYQDAIRCIQKHDELPNSPYGNYVRRMMAQ